jgi:hypothetical protein
VLRLDEI